MNHYVVYHNREVMGYDAGTINGFQIVTAKSVSGAVGNRVWVIAGRGKPRRYALCLTFIAETAGPVPDDPRISLVRSSKGTKFRREIELNHLGWFPDFRQTMGNFGLGFQRITDVRFIQALEAIRLNQGAAPQDHEEEIPDEPNDDPNGEYDGDEDPDLSFDEAFEQVFGGGHPEEGAMHSDGVGKAIASRERSTAITRAVSIRQPYVEQILRGKKRIEFRSRPTNIRERLFLYASLTPAPRDEWEAAKMIPGDLPTGKIVGSVEIVDCRYNTRREIYEWHLARPRRLRQHRTPTNQPQPGIWRPQF